MLNTYINFKGNCREAFEFYRSVFDGEFAIMQTFGDGPDDMGVLEEEKNNVMHVSFPIGDSVLMGSDVPSGFGMTHMSGQQLLDQRWSRQQEKRLTDCSAGCRKVAQCRCPWQTCFGVHTSVHAPTSSASTGRLTTSKRPSKNRADVVGVSDNTIN